MKNGLKSGPKIRLERIKIQNFSYPGKGDTPFPGPYPPQPRPFGPRRVSSPPQASALRALANLAPPWQKASCAYVGYHVNWQFCTVNVCVNGCII